MTTRTIAATSAMIKMWLKTSLLALLVGCGSNQVSIGEQNGDASAGGAIGSADAPVVGGATSSSSAMPEGGAILVGGTTGAAGASALGGNSSTSVLAGSTKVGGSSSGGATLLGGTTSGGGKTGGSSGTVNTGGSVAPRCGGIAGLKCPSGSFCDYGTCAVVIADAMGTCVAQPEVCPMNYAPVCGCDGKIYSNDCVRAGAGVSRAPDGACGGTGGSGGTGGKTGTGGAGGTTGSSSSAKRNCASDGTCGTGAFCDFPIGNCGETFTTDPAGLCVSNGGIGGCIAVVQPVCGCDGKTYNNDCERIIAGVSKRAEGVCSKADGGVSDTGASNAALCVATGGTVSTAQCCASTGDFPNSCLTGPCGCAPASSHTVNTCICPTGCFVPGEGCFKCTLGADQTCNNDPTLSALSGKCQSNGRCSCNAGYLPVANGRCQADTP